MKVLGYVPLHYGKEFLKESILSYNDLVDKIVILYSKNPSYGHGTSLQCPESEEELKDLVFSTTNKAEWVNISANNEGAHRTTIWNYADGYDLILATDADEVWKTDELERELKSALSRPFARYGINGFLNFWKTFNHVCLDGFVPIRIYKPGGIGEGISYATIYHFGYAISEELMRYKWAIHGHKSELRKNWIDGVYLSDKKEDLHPVALGLWNAVSFDKNTLPDSLKAHPKFSL